MVLSYVCHGNVDIRLGHVVVEIGKPGGEGCLDVVLSARLTQPAAQLTIVMQMVPKGSEDCLRCHGPSFVKHQLTLRLLPRAIKARSLKGV